MCDMCSSPESVYRIELEGSRLNVCEKCSSYGRIIARLKREEPVKKSKKKKQGMFEHMDIKPKKESETVQIITSTYPGLIKKKREKLGLKQKELAKKIAEKESVIHKLESGRIKPGIPLARKLEKFLRIKVIEEVELDDPGISSKKKGLSGDITIGDLINIK
ncbi:multiprotein bridging factor aMBF1 [Candidatus Woesearchaeota archaeon]|nr:multiprotein bridging factor aMBF1 [Candidatus Woesearchaeota archaeon]